MKNRHTNYAGFTIIELMVVIAMIGILATLITLNVSSGRYRSNYTKILAEMNTIAHAAKLYNDEVSRWPSQPAGNTIPSELSTTKYLESWPHPPCTGYQYDWINTTESGPTGPVTKVGVLYKHTSTPANIIYYYDLNGYLYDLAAINIQRGYVPPIGQPLYFDPKSITDTTINSISCSELYR